MKLTVCGIDPGRHGAFAIITFESNNMTIQFIPMPWSKGALDAKMTAQIMGEKVASDCLVFCEELAPFARIGSRKSIFSMGSTFGATIAAIKCAGIEPTLIKPKSWQASVFPKRGTNREKMKTWLTVKKLGMLEAYFPHDGFADAFLIACAVAIKRKAFTFDQIATMKKEIIAWRPTKKRKH